MTLLDLLSLFSGICFLFYGFNCLFSKHMVIEFKRFGIPQFLKLTGSLQVLGGLALLIGPWILPILAFIGATGLFVLMFMGFLVRLKIKDSFLRSAPAFIFALLNAYISYAFFTLF